MRGVGLCVSYLIGPASVTYSDTCICHTRTCARARALSLTGTHTHTHVRMPKATANFEQWRINYLGVKISTLLFGTVLSLRYHNACLGL
jgi:hypothetical protein